MSPSSRDAYRPGRRPAPIIGFDLVRDPDGTFLVLEDNLRTPSGIAYLDRRPRCADGGAAGHDPAANAGSTPRSTDCCERRSSARRRRAPAPIPQLLVLTDGPANNAYYEHARLAAAIGAPIATLGQLHTDGELIRRCAPTTQSHRQIDVVYRRTDVDWIRDARGAMTPVAQALAAGLAGGQSWARQRVRQRRRRRQARPQPRRGLRALLPGRRAAGPGRCRRRRSTRRSRAPTRSSDCTNSSSSRATVTAAPA